MDYKIGRYTISSICLQSYPCKHAVYDKNTAITRTMRGDDIYCMLQDENLSHEHFDTYKEYIRRHQNPTAEELAEDIAYKAKIEEQRKQREIEEVKRVLERDKYKASSYLERLKARHNITKNT